MKMENELKRTLHNAIIELRKFSNGGKSSVKTEEVIDNLWKEFWKCMDKEKQLKSSK